MSTVNNIVNTLGRVTGGFNTVKSLAARADGYISGAFGAVNSVEGVFGLTDTEGKRKQITRLTGFPVTGDTTTAPFSLSNLIQNPFATGAMDHSNTHLTLNNPIGNFWTNYLTIPEDVDPVILSNPMVFFSAPNLSIFDTTSKTYRTFEEQNAAIKRIFNFNISDMEKYLDGSIIVPLSQGFKSVTLPDFVLSVDEAMSSIQKARLAMPSHFNGMYSGTFDTKHLEFGNTINYRILLTWFSYIKAVTMGQISPTLSNIYDNIADYKVSCYVFQMKPNLIDLAYACRFSGVMPTSAPNSAFSSDTENPEVVYLNQQWSYDYMEYLNTDMLDDFVKLVQDEFKIYPSDPKNANAQYSFNYN